MMRTQKYISGLYAAARQPSCFAASLEAMLRVIVMAALVLGLFRQATAQGLDPAKAITQYRHETWTKAQGLPQSSVLDIVETRDGYLWLVTFDGLVRFDGVAFTIFNRTNTKELRSSGFWTLYEDRRGALWIGSNGGGLTQYKDGRFKTYSSQDGLASDVVLAIAEDSLSTADSLSLWIGTRGGLSHLRLTTTDAAGSEPQAVFTSYTSANGLLHSNVNALVCDTSGTLWIGTTNGLSSRRKHATAFEHFGAMQGQTAWAMYADRSNALWIATDGGLRHLQNRQLKTFTVKDGLPSVSIWALHEDVRGTLWIATNAGLCRYRNGKFDVFSVADGLSDAQVSAFCSDREGNLWVGTYRGGLNRLNDGKFLSYTVKEGLPGDVVYHILKSQSGAIWMATVNGIACLKDGKITAYTEKDGLPGSEIRSLAEDRAGNIWIGAQGGGLLKMTLPEHSGGRGNASLVFTTYTTQNGLADNRIKSVLVTLDGSVWAGTMNGISRFKDGRFTNYSMKDGLAADLVISLFESRDSSLWIATDGGGISRFHQGR
ncbi:MAG: hypothetical protein IAF08_04115, partial [Rhizobacter sp.]|nr:hypothetical protein [Chlorobiales bacterium]